MRTALLHSVILVFTSLVVFSCKTYQPALTPEQYKKWYASDAFVWRKTDTINGLIYSIAFVPGQVDIARCALENCKPKEELKQAQKDLGKDYDFILQIQTKSFNESVVDKARPELTRNEIMTYLNGQIKSDLCGMSIKNDTLSCTGIIYEPISSDRVRILFSIEGKEPLNKIVFQDRIFSGYTQNFGLPELTLKTTPSLKF